MTSVVGRVMGGAGGSFGASSPFYQPLVHCDEAVSLCGNGTEAFGQSYEATTGVFSGLAVTIPSNANTGTITMVARLGGTGDRNNTVSFTSTQIGTQTWSGANDNVTAGDAWSLHCTTTTTGGAAHGGMGIRFQPASGTVTTMGSAGTSGAGSVGTTSYTTLVGGDSNQNTTESISQVYVQAAGTITNFYVTFATNSRTDSQTYTVGKGGVAQGNTITFTTTQTGRQLDSSHSSTFAVGNLLDCIITGGGGSGSCNSPGNGYAWTSTTDGQYWGGGARSNATATGSTFYIAPVGDIRPTATQSLPQVETNCAMSFSGLWTNVTANASTNTTSMKFEKGNSAQSQTVSYTSTQTGTQQDSNGAHVDTVGATDLIDIVTSGMNGNVTFIGRTMAQSVTPLAANTNKFSFHAFP